MSVTRGRSCGNQRPLKCRVCGGWVKGWGPVQHPAGGPDPVRALHISWPTSAKEVQAGANCNCLQPDSPRAQSYFLGPISPRTQGGIFEQGGPSLHIPKPKEPDIPAKMAPLHVNIGDTKWVYHCQVEGCPKGPSSSHAAICTHMCHAHLGMKLSCPFYPIIFFNTNALKWHGKWAHHSRFSCPT